MTEFSPRELEKSHEMPPIPTTASLVYEVFAEVDGDTSRQEVAARKAIEMACGNALTPAEQRALAMAGEMMMWRLFGGQGKPLPEGYVKIQFDDPYPEQSVVLDPDYFDESSWRAAERIFRQCGLDGVLDERMRQRKRRISDLHEGIVEAMQETPVHRFMQSFDMEQPRAMTEASLSLAWRTIRQVQIEAEVRKKYGLTVNETMSPQARQALGQALWRLDEETRRRREKPAANNPFLRAEEYFIRFMRDGWPEDTRRIAGEGAMLIYNERDDNLYLLPPGVTLDPQENPSSEWKRAGAYVNINDFTGMFFDQLTDGAYIPTEGAERFGISLARDFIRELFDYGKKVRIPPIRIFCMTSQKRARYRY